MKKIFRALTLCLVLLSLLCAAVPAAFAAGNKEDAFYTIGLDACGGVSSTVVVTTNLDGKLTTLPESPTMDGYTFNGWYTEPVRGHRVTAPENLKRIRVAADATRIEPILIAPLLAVPLLLLLLIGLLVSGRKRKQK